MPLQVILTKNASESQYLQERRRDGCAGFRFGWQLRISAKFMAADKTQHFNPQTT